MKYELDTHTHTIASGHAYNSMCEMIQAAAKKGLKIIGITDHAPAMPGSTHRYYFTNMISIDNEELSHMYGIEVLWGIEANIMDKDGKLDMENAILGKLDVVIASMHLPCYPPGTKEENTNAAIEVLKNPTVDILGHPEDGRYPLDYEAVVRTAKEYGKLIELNNSSLKPKAYRKNGRENSLELLRLCKQYNQPIVINSDAHLMVDIGNRKYVEPLLIETNFPEELVINTSADAFRKMIQKGKRNGRLLDNKVLNC